MKKFTSLLLTFVILFGLISSFPSGLLVNASGEVTFESLMLDAIGQHKTKVDLSPLNISSDESSVFFKYLNDFHYSHPEIFYVDFNFSETGGSISFTVSGGKILSFEIQYSMNSSEITVAEADYESRIQAILSEMPLLSGLSDIGKALTVHDYLIMNYDYDDSLEKHDVYSMLTTGEGVCEAYTLLYTELLSRVGINSSYSSSQAMGHVWNLVEIDGNWYHVDVTWDDPTNSTSPRKIDMISYEYFLKSDAEFISAVPQAKKHYDNFDDKNCYDTAFDNYFWNDLTAPVIYTDANTCWYLKYADNVCKLYKKCGTKVTSFDISSKITDKIWYVYSGSTKTNSYYPGFYSGLAYYNGKLYFNGTDNVYCFDIKTESLSKLFQANGITKGNILNLKTEDYVLSYEVSPDVNQGGKLYSAIIAASLYEVIPSSLECENGYITGITEGKTISEYNLPDCVTVYNKDGKKVTSGTIKTGYVIKLTVNGKVIDSATAILQGDINCDGVADTSDLADIKLTLYGLKSPDATASKAADMNDDGSITEIDYIMLKLFLIGK